MPADSDIPILTDLIEEKIEITPQELGLDMGGDLVINEDDGPEYSFNPKILEPAMKFDAATRIGNHPELEQSIRRILDEHLERAWQEIRLAIELCLNDKDGNI